MRARAAALSEMAWPGGSAPGDADIITGHTPHWWSEPECGIECLIFRPDPGYRLELR